MPTRNRKHAAYEHAFAIRNGFAAIHPLHNRVASVHYYDKHKVLTPRGEKGHNSRLAMFELRRMPDGDEVRTVWWPMNAEAEIELAQMSAEERKDFMAYEPTERIKQECESKAILNGSRFKAVRFPKKEAEIFPAETPARRTLTKAEREEFENNS